MTRPFSPTRVLNRARYRFLPDGLLRPKDILGADRESSCSARQDNPSSTIHIAAATSKTEDHRILGELALYLAQVYDGVIDFDGALIPASTLSLDERANLTRVFEANWSKIAAPRERFFARLPGKIVAVPYKTGSGREWVSHVGDTEFMAAWLAHPDFHMIK